MVRVLWHFENTDNSYIMPQTEADTDSAGQQEVWFTNAWQVADSKILQHKARLYQSRNQSTAWHSCANSLSYIAKQEHAAFV